MPDYGVDMMCGTDLDPLLRDDSGEGMMQRVCVRRLCCPRGRMLSAPNAITLDARQLVGRAIKGDVGLAEIKGLCEQALLDDERVFAVEVLPSFSAATRLLELRITGVGAEGPFALTLAVSELTVEQLRGG